jgi:hypothetical protein
MTDLALPVRLPDPVRQIEPAFIVGNTLPRRHCRLGTGVKIGMRSEPGKGTTFLIDLA